MTSPSRPSGPFRVGLVGAGHISEFHLHALRRIPELVQVVGIHDLDAERVRQTAERFSIPILPSLEALRDAGAEVIHVLTPPRTHAGLALRALELGCDVFVEKPVATDVADAERLRDFARSVGRQVGVCHSLLFDPQVRQALADVRAGALGRLVSVDILRSSVYPPYAGGPLPPHYRDAGYPFRDIGIHCLYLLEAFLGPIADVQAAWASLGGDSNLAFDEWRAQVKCEKGLGQFQLSWNVKPLQNQIILQGDRGVRRVDLFLMFQATRARTPLPKAAERLINAATDSLQPLIDVPRGVLGFLRGQVRQYHGLQDLVVAFYEALARGERVPVTVDDALATVRWTEEIARAAERDHASRTRAPSSPSRASNGTGEPVSGAVDWVVTGASGGLGSALVERLRAEKRGRGRVLVRRAASVQWPDVEVVTGDLGNPDAVARAVAGARIVFHVGATMKGGWPEHQGGTIEGTRNVIEACAAAGVEKLVHVSSLSVIDWAGGETGSAVDESSAYEPRPEERGAYTRAKLEAERLVRSAVADRGLPAVIVRPGQIFGGKLPLLTGAIARRVGGRWLVLGDGTLPLPLVYIEDVVDALLAAADSSLRNGEIVQLVDPERLTQNDVLEALLGGNARVVRVPRAAVFGAGKLSEWLLAPAKKASPLSAYRLRSALAVRRFESRHAEPLLGWKPRVGVREGIRRVAAESQP